MSVFTSILHKTSSGKNLLVLFLSSHLILLSMLLFTFPKINSQIGSKAFDLLTFGYSRPLAQNIIDKLDASTTQVYLFPQLTLLDLFYPLLLALFLSSLLFRLIQKNSPLKTLLLWIPFLGMLFDYSENVCIILMITKTIEASEIVVKISSSLTLLKGLFTTLAWLAILFYALPHLVEVYIRFKQLAKGPL